MHNTFHHTIFEDSTSGMELKAFKEKIRKLYAEILAKTYKQANPGATPEEIAAYVEENNLEFPGDDDDSVDEEVDNLMEMLDEMVDGDELEPVTEMITEGTPKTQTGEQLQSKTHEKGDKVITQEIQDHLGGLFKGRSEERKKVRTAPMEPMEVKHIKRESFVPHNEQFRPMFEKMRDDLRKLADRQRIGVHHFREGI